LLTILVGLAVVPVVPLSGSSGRIWRVRPAGPTCGELPFRRSPPLWSTKRVAEVERNRFLAVGAVRMNRERHGLKVSHMTVKRVLKSLEAERTAA
jgi:hypothetical protein